MIHSQSTSHPRSTRVLTWSHRALFAFAAVALGYCGYVLSDSWMFQKAEREKFALLVPAQPPGLAPAAIVTPLPVADGLIGNIQIARLGLSVMIAEGVTQNVLRHAAGHIPGTALPGQPGNVGISAHRDTFFRPLRDLQRDDAITLTTAQGRFKYRVVSTKIVAPENTQVLAPDPGNSQVLTLVTCYPFYYVGPAPNRFIVRAERMI
jgi:sortase A